jgi:hypothetical protein
MRRKSVKQTLEQSGLLIINSLVVDFSLFLDGTGAVDLLMHLD